MYNKLWSVFNTLFNFEKSITDAQMPLCTINFQSPEDMKQKLQSRTIQLAMVDWVQNTLRPLENNANYLAVARGSKFDQHFVVDTATIKKVIEIMMPYVLLGTPAHDLGHHIFDALGGASLISDDPFIALAYRNEINGAFFGTMFHDSSTGVQHRYVDNEWELNHGEIAACIFYFNTMGLLPYNMRLLAAYAIAAHPHMLKEMPMKNGTVRKLWNDELFYDGDKPIRLAVWLTRWTDRLENGADSVSHLPRHTLAALDGARVNGFDLTGVDWFSFNDQLKFLFYPEAKTFEFPVLDDQGNPVLKDGVPVVTKIPTMLQSLQGYRISADTSKVSPYNQHDDKSKNMRRLMDWKIENSMKFVDLVTNTIGDVNFDKFVRLMRMKSGNPISQTNLDTIQMVRDLWSHNTPEDQAHWAYGFDLAYDSYFSWVNLLKIRINSATDPTIQAFAPLVPEMVNKIL